MLGINLPGSAPTLQSACLLLLAFLAFCNLTSCDLTWLDHPTNQGLKRELIDRSKEGLALAMITSVSEHQPSLDLRFFDDRRVTYTLDCCRDAGGEVSRNRIVVTSDNVPFIPNIEDLTAFLLNYKGGQVVLLNTQGKIMDRSDARVQAGVLALSPDQKRFAFIGRPGERTPQDDGVYVAGFHGPEMQKLGNVSPDQQVRLFEQTYPVLTRKTLDWSPDGESLLLGDGGAIVLLDAHTGRARKIGDGGGARWSPSSNLITYVSPKVQAVLLNVTTGQTRLIDPGRQVLSPVEWSPDGRYLLIAEGQGCHVPFGCLWVYRVSDGSFAPILSFGSAGRPPHWIQVRSD